MRVLRSLLVLALVAVPAVATAQTPTPPADWVPDETWMGIILPFDDERLVNLPETRAAALEEAAKAPDLPAVAALADAPTTPGDLDAILGDWRCRTIKIGGLLPLTIYSYFACTIGRDDAGFFIEKTSGSQRFTGRLYLGKAPGELIFLGAGHYSDEAPQAYGADPERNQVRILRQLAPDQLLLKLPRPIFESNHDWIEFVR